MRRVGVSTLVGLVGMSLDTGVPTLPWAMIYLAHRKSLSSLTGIMVYHLHSQEWA